MNHNVIRHMLSEYIDGSVSAREKAEIEAHLETCVTCRDACRELRITVSHIKTIEEAEPPVWMTQKIMAEARSIEAANKSLFQRFFTPLRIKIPVGAVAIVFLAVSAFYLYNSMKPPAGVDKLTTESDSSGQLATIPPSGNPRSYPSGQAREEQRVQEGSSVHGREVPQAPSYKSLDMRPEYAPPAPPVRKDEETAPSSDQTKPVERPPSATETMTVKKSAAMQAPTQSHEPVHQGDSETISLAQAGKATAGETISGESTSEGKQTEAEVVKNLGAYFIEHDLPPTMTNRKYTISKIRVIPSSMQWLDLEARSKLASCRNGYLVDVEPAGRTLRCIYCVDNDSVELISKYARRNDRWVGFK